MQWNITTISLNYDLLHSRNVRICFEDFWSLWLTWKPQCIYIHVSTSFKIRKCQKFLCERNIFPQKTLHTDGLVSPSFRQSDFVVRRQTFMLQLALRQACFFPKKNGTNALFRNGLLGETWSRGIVQMEHLIAEM